MFTPLFAAALLVLTLISALALPASAAPDADRYGGLEFLGSSQITKAELEKMLGLKPGASVSSAQKAVDHVQQQLLKRRVRANFEMVSVPPDQIYIAADVLDSSNESIPSRRLVNPHHVIWSTDTPLNLLDKLHARLAAVAAQGRVVVESYENGEKHFSDEPCDQIVSQLKRFAPGMRDELLSTIETEPDPMLRIKAIEVLNWAGSWSDTCARLLPALEDSDWNVRSATDRFIYPRIGLLNDEFPFGQLVDALSRQLRRPTHSDRSKSLSCLLALAKAHQSTLRDIKALCETRLQELSKDSVVPTVHDASVQLLHDLEEWNKGPLPTS